MKCSSCGMLLELHYGLEPTCREAGRANRQSNIYKSFSQMFAEIIKETAPEKYADLLKGFEDVQKTEQRNLSKVKEDYEKLKEPLKSDCRRYVNGKRNNRDQETSDTIQHH